MAETFTLDAQPRTITGKQVSQLRDQGLIPAVIYGARTKPIHVQIPTRALETTLRQAGGTSLINLNLSTGKQTVIAREVQRHILKGSILHVDFLAVDATTKLTTTVQIQFINESPAVKSGLGVLLTGISSLTLEALPADLIDKVEIDLANLENLNDTIYVRDLDLGDKVTILSDHEEMIVRVTVQSVEEETVEEEASASEPEVIKRAKEEEVED